MKKLRYEQGFTLIISIILLLVLTIFALSQVSYNTMLTRIASNSADRLIAFQTAEGALNQAATQLLSGAYTAAAFASNSNGLYVLNPNASPIFNSVDWSASSAVITSYQGNSSLSASYIIEQLPSIVRAGKSMSKPSPIYRITARALGASGGVPVILQAIVEPVS